MTPVDFGWQPLELLGAHHTLMKTQPKKTTRKGTFANLTDRTHARLQRRAAAADLKPARYVAVATEFLLDLEDAFGGPLTQQFRAMILRNVSGMASIMEKALKQGA